VFRNINVTGCQIKLNNLHPHTGVFKAVLILSFFIISHLSNAQLVDTLKYSLQQKPRFFITLASFNTFIDHQYANIGGVRLGLAFNQRIRFGLGFFNLANNAVVSRISIPENDQEYITNGHLYFNFVSVSGEYFFFSEYPWQCTFTPFHLGYGRGKYEYVDRLTQKRIIGPSEGIILYQPELSAQYSIFRWLGVGITSGYRFTLYRSKKLTQELDAPTFAVDIRLFLDEVYKILFLEDKKSDISD